MTSVADSFFYIAKPPEKAPSPHNTACVSRNSKLKILHDAFRSLPVVYSFFYGRKLAIFLSKIPVVFFPREYCFMFAIWRLQRKREPKRLVPNDFSRPLLVWRELEGFLPWQKIIYCKSDSMGLSGVIFFLQKRKKAKLAEPREWKF